MYCIKCGTKNDDSSIYCMKCGEKIFKPQTTSIVCKQPPVNPVKNQAKKLTCRRCGSENVSVSFEEYEQRTSGKSETRKKSIVTRAGNTAGRTGMILATGGLWALTPKKSKYKTVGTMNTKTVHRKMAICQDCGNSWRVF